MWRREDESWAVEDERLRRTAPKKKRRVKQNRFQLSRRQWFFCNLSLVVFLYLHDYFFSEVLSKGPHITFDSAQGLTLVRKIKPQLFFWPRFCFEVEANTVVSWARLKRLGQVCRVQSFSNHHGDSLLKSQREFLLCYIRLQPEVRIQVLSVAETTQACSVHACGRRRGIRVWKAHLLREQRGSIRQLHSANVT